MCRQFEWGRNIRDELYNRQNWRFLRFVKNQLITYEIHKLRRKIKVSTTNATKPKFDIHLSLEGTLAELHFSDHKKVLNEKRLEKDISEEMEERIQKSIKLVQKNIR